MSASASSSSSSVCHSTDPANLTQEELDTLAKALNRINLAKAQHATTAGEPDPKSKAVGSKCTVRKSKLAILSDYNFVFGLIHPEGGWHKLALCTQNKTEQDEVIDKIKTANKAALVVDCDVCPTPDLSKTFAELIILKNFEQLSTLGHVINTRVSRPIYEPDIIAVCPSGRLTINDQKHFDVYICLNNRPLV